MADGIRVDGGLVSHTRVAGANRRRQSTARDASPSPPQRSTGTAEDPPPAKSKARGEVRRRRGIRPKSDLSGKPRADTAGKSPPKQRARRRAPGPRPNKPQALRSPPTPTPVPAPKAQPVPPVAAPPGEHLDFGWLGWAGKQRRLLLATALGFLAGLFVYALLGPEETPEPQTTAGAGEGRAGKRETARTGTPADRSAPSPARARKTPAGGYGVPAVPGNSYQSRVEPAPNVYQPYPGATYRSTPTFEQYVPDHYRPTPADESYPADRWPSPEGRSLQRTFKQPYGGADYGAQRPWGSPDDRRRTFQDQPQAPYADYPAVLDPYAPLPDYPGPAGDYYPPGRPAPY